MGYLDDLIGPKRTIVLSLIGLDRRDDGRRYSPSAKVWLWVAGVLMGVFAGPNQSASRSLMVRFVPAGMQNEFFGFFAFSGKLTAFVGPLALGVATQLTGSQRAGISVVLLMLTVGLVLLLAVNEPKRAASARTGA